MKKQPAVTAKTRKTIIDAFIKLYKTKPIEKISIQEITALAGYNRSTFYQYFGDIYLLLDYAEDALITEIKGLVLANMKQDQHRQLLYEIAEFYNQNGEYLTALLGKHSNGAFAERIKDAMRPSLIAQFGIEETHMNISYMLEFALSAIISTLIHWYRQEKSIPAQELVSLIQSMLKDGVYPRIATIKATPNK